MSAVEPHRFTNQTTAYAEFGNQATHNFRLILAAEFEGYNENGGKSHTTPHCRNYSLCHHRISAESLA